MLGDLIRYNGNKSPMLAFSPFAQVKWLRGRKYSLSDEPLISLSCKWYIFSSIPGVAKSAKYYYIDSTIILYSTITIESELLSRGVISKTGGWGE